MLQPGTSALFLMVEKVTPDKATEAMGQYGGTVLKTSLSKEGERNCRTPCTATRRPLSRHDRRPAAELAPDAKDIDRLRHDGHRLQGRRRTDQVNEHVIVRVPLAGPVTDEWLRRYQRLAHATGVPAQAEAGPGWSSACQPTATSGK